MTTQTVNATTNPARPLKKSPWAAVDALLALIVTYGYLRNGDNDYGGQRSLREVSKRGQEGVRPGIEEGRIARARHADAAAVGSGEEFIADSEDAANFTDGASRFLLHLISL
jgi:hypothetical protein